MRVTLASGPISRRAERGLSNAADGIDCWGQTNIILLIFNDTRGDVTLVTPFQSEM
jgi:hypothetical protein